jgi:hypothetical protein
LLQTQRYQWFLQALALQQDWQEQVILGVSNSCCGERDWSCISNIGAHDAPHCTLVLQDCGQEEWFTRYMKPSVHYIPMAEDLSNMKETLQWVKDHPKEVRTIAENGHTFMTVF